MAKAPDSIEFTDLNVSIDDFEVALQDARSVIDTNLRYTYSATRIGGTDRMLAFSFEGDVIRAVRNVPAS